MSKKLTFVLAALLALPAEAGILRYTFRAKDSSADPTARIPQFIIADTEVECPASDVADGDICYAKDSDDMQVRTNGAWADMYPSVGGSGDSARVEDGNDAGTYTDATDADFSDQGDINFALDTATTPDQITATVRADSVALTTDTTGNYAAGDGEAGNALTGDSATAFFSSGTIEDARIDGSAEADEVNPTLGTQTQGNYLADLTAGLGLAESITAGEGATGAFSIDYAQTLAGNPALNIEECIFSSEGTASGGFLCEGTTANTNEQLYLFPGSDGADTTNYFALGASDGDALAGDSATAFFDAGTIEDARIDGSAEADELTLVGDVDGAANANDIDEASVEAELESVIDLPDLQGTLDVASGGTGAAPGADDQVLVSDSVSGATWRGLSDCNTENMLTYSTATNTFGCEADDGGAGSGLDHPKVMMRLSYGGF